MNQLRIASLILLISWATVSCANETDASDSAAEELLASARVATGSSDATLQRVIVSDAHCTGPQGEYETMTSSAPIGYWYRQKHPGQVPYAALITEEGGWVLLAEGKRGVLKPHVYLMVKSHDYQRIAIDPTTFARDLTLVGPVQYQGRDCIQINGTVGDGTGIDFFYLEKDHMPAGFRMNNPFDPFDPVNIVYRDWRAVDGVMLPSVVAALDSKGEYVLNYHTIYFDEVLPPLEEAPAPEEQAPAPEN